MLEAPRPAPPRRKVNRPMLNHRIVLAATFNPSAAGADEIPALVSNGFRSTNFMFCTRCGGTQGISCQVCTPDHTPMAILTFMHKFTPSKVGTNYPIGVWPLQD